MLVPILRAAHCRSTHHFFAIDALERIGTERGKRLADLLLKHYAVYLRGAKDPDDKFKDFQNHVIHVRQNNWGGAPRACQQWLNTALENLRSREWSQAAYACGVLSHYFTDPIMPLHTGQTERESVVHRPMEWSICKAYDEIYSQCLFSKAASQLQLSESQDWICQAVLHCAGLANQHYDRLIEIYNLPRGVVDPPRGLTKEARQILGELFELAVGGWASVLMRIATLMDGMPPDCSLTMATLIAGIDVPRASIVKKFSNIAQQQEVNRIFDEYTETGKLIDNLPQEIKVVRREYDNELKREPSRQFKTTNALPELQGQLDLRSDSEVADPATHVDDSANSVDENPTPLPTETTTTLHSQADILPDRHADESGNRGPQREPTSPASMLSLEAPIVDAPSIGPKTAKRFEAIGVHTIAQFLESDASQLAQRLDANWITPELVVQWQDQAELVCRVPALCGYKAQLLVAVGCSSVEALATAQDEELELAIRQYVGTTDGQRIIRSAKIPTQSDIAEWILSAQSAL